jgi:hypothetical protein
MEVSNQMINHAEDADVIILDEVTTVAKSVEEETDSTALPSSKYQLRPRTNK